MTLGIAVGAERPAAAPMTFNGAPAASLHRTAGGSLRGQIPYNYFALAPGGAGDAQDITVGADGNLWITTNCLGAIERMTPAGSATASTYGMPGQCDTSLSITPGPDGNLWFVDQFANIVGKITTAGVVTTYPLPSASPCNYYPTAPIGITPRPDGAMWFTVSTPGSPFCQGMSGYTPAIGRITTQGSMSFLHGTTRRNTYDRALPHHHRFRRIHVLRLPRRLSGE